MTSYPRLAARTARFTLGIPRGISVSPDGRSVRYLRTPDGVTRTGQLWEHDVASGTDRVLVDPDALLGEEGEQLSAEERSRRERSREGGAGIVDYSVDAAGRFATFALSGRAWIVDLVGGDVAALPSTGDVVDPRIDPTGRRVAYAAAGALRVVDVAGNPGEGAGPQAANSPGEGAGPQAANSPGGGAGPWAANSTDRALVEPESETQVWGLADFIAAEELSRHRGFWWSPDGESLLVEVYDEAPVQTWFVSDPEHPERQPVAQRYPAAGTPNAEVRLWHLGLDGTRAEVTWDRERFEYLASVSWTEHGVPVVQVMSRDQRSAQVLAVDVGDGSTAVLRELSDQAWVEVTSAPRFGPGGYLVGVEDRDGVRRLVVDGEPVGEATWQVRGIVSVHADAVVVTASDEPTEVHVVRIGLDGSTEPVTSSAAVHSAVTGGGAGPRAADSPAGGAGPRAADGLTTVISRAGLDVVGTTITVHHDGGSRPVTVAAEPAPFEPAVTLLHAGPHALRTAVLFPRDHVPGARRLPVLMDPYGGPHAQRVLANARMFLEPQWLADQGFCVIVADGRGTPGRGAAWEREVLDSLAEVTLADQVDALEAVAAQFPDDVDVSRVGITGWSYGGYLSALAVLARPDVFHAAVAGAPVTEWRLYDTAYTERYLGDPTLRPEVYDRNSLLPLAKDLQRPLMLVHGLADDNVVAAHTLQLSSALLAAGRPHTVLPLSGVTHMTTAEVVAENLKLLQVDFLKTHLHA
ncbi:prolyl oligopeptidase family serine peptidase [Aeromicrobium sp. CTD01-1L150]|uniref:S9 family peptidase n=1 Tax=Aeromicrobium sp. CTD01-1L150 TaxID=3341830 RepID=UPI0035BF3D71